MKRTFPKIELHLHLDGSMLPETAWELAKEQGVVMPAEDLEGFRKFIVVTADCRSVNEYLERFELPLRLLQKPAALTRVTKELICLLHSQGVAYGEIRFAPQLHTREEMCQRDAVEAVLKGREEGLALCPGMGVNILLCAMSIGTAEINKKENLETVDLAAQYLGKGVAAVDLAGAEGIVPLREYGYVFDRAKELGVPFTCHAGDSQGPETVKDALDFGTKRIGHGHRIIEVEALCQRAVKEGVTLEICPTSNIQCQSQPSYEAHPAKRLFDMGMRITINTDNMILSDIDLDKEYDHCVKEMGFTEQDLIRMNLYAVEASFQSVEEKEKLAAKLRAYLKEERRYAD